MWRVFLYLVVGFGFFCAMPDPVRKSLNADGMIVVIVLWPAIPVAFIVTKLTREPVPDLKVKP